MGTPSGPPMRRKLRRLTLPYIHAIAAAGDDERRWMADAFASGRCEDGELTRMREVVEARGGVEYSLGKAGEFGRAAREALEQLAESDSRASLAGLVDYVMQCVRR